jgi:hypothetical protein
MLVVIGGLAAASALVVAQRASAQPGGSYLQSCRRVEERGPMLFALCKDMNGQWRRTRIDVRRCRTGIANTDGELTCG